MLCRFSALGASLGLDAQEPPPAKLSGFLDALSSGERKSARRLLAELEPRIEVLERLVDGEAQLILVCFEASARPLARLIQNLAPVPLNMRVGRAPVEHSLALLRAQEETGVDLSTSRIRLGFSRGHLLEAVVQIPLDIRGDQEALQLASEIYLEEILGDSTIDTWVGSVATDRIARTRGLLMASDLHSSSESHPIAETAKLAQLGILGVMAELPTSVFAHVSTSDWTALEMSPGQDGVQPGRLFASTRYPEALKAALEGLPFSSARFTRGDELFCWFSWNARGVSRAHRLETRASLEAHIQSAEFSEFCQLAGSGFGENEDFLDLWVRPDDSRLGEVLQRAACITGGLHFSSYDSDLADEVLHIRPS